MAFEPPPVDRPATQADDAPAPAKPRKGMGFRKASLPRLAQDCAQRQGAITQLAFLLLGREEAIAFLNTDHAGLGGRPLDLATASIAGRASVEAELGRMTYNAS